MKKECIKCDQGFELGTTDRETNPLKWKGGDLEPGTFRLQHQQPKPLGHTAFCSGGCDIHLPFCIVMSHPVVVWHSYVTSICCLA